jgi:hypothetical protein
MPTDLTGSDLLADIKNRLTSLLAGTSDQQTEGLS